MGRCRVFSDRAVLPTRVAFTCTELFPFTRATASAHGSRSLTPRVSGREGRCGAGGGANGVGAVTHGSAGRAATALNGRGSRGAACAAKRDERCTPTAAFLRTKAAASCHRYAARGASVSAVLRPTPERVSKANGASSRRLPFATSKGAPSLLGSGSTKG